MRGKFIVFDGGDGAGKSSVLKYVCEQLGERVVQTREPGGTPFAEDIRSLILSERGGQAKTGTLFLLFWAGRHEHVTHLVQPILEQGRHVLCDRFDSSTWAYQIRGEGHLHLKILFRQLRTFAPDHYIIFDGDPRVLLPRAKRRAAAGERSTHFDDRELAYHDRVRRGFLEFVRDKPHTVLNAEEPVEAVRQRALDIVCDLVSQ